MSLETASPVRTDCPIRPGYGFTGLNRGDFHAQGTRGVVPLPIVPAAVLMPSSGAGPGLSGTLYRSPAPTLLHAAESPRGPVDSRWRVRVNVPLPD